MHPRGHGSGVRMEAEGAGNNFVPSTGTVTLFVKPTGPGIRVDSGIESGDEITQFYDPMIAKLIVYSEDRTSAIERLQAALKQEVVFGVKTNSPLLLAITKHPAFRQGRTYTSFLEEYGFIGEKGVGTHPQPEKTLQEQQTSNQNPLHIPLFPAAMFALV